MKVIDINEYRKKLKKLKELTNSVDPLSKKLVSIEKEHKLELKKRALNYNN